MLAAVFVQASVLMCLQRFLYRPASWCAFTAARHRCSLKKWMAQSSVLLWSHSIQAGNHMFAFWNQDLWTFPNTDTLVALIRSDHVATFNTSFSICLRVGCRQHSSQQVSVAWIRSEFHCVCWCVHICIYFHIHGFLVVSVHHSAWTKSSFFFARVSMQECLTLAQLRHASEAIQEIWNASFCNVLGRSARKKN